MYVGVQGKECSVTYVCAFQLQGNYVWATGHTSIEFKIREAWDWRVRVRNDRVSLGDFWEWQLELGWMRRCSVADIQQNLLQYPKSAHSIRSEIRQSLPYLSMYMGS